jgi:CRISPR type III-A-associated protein Csm2
MATLETFNGFYNASGMIEEKHIVLEGNNALDSVISYIVKDVKANPNQREERNSALNINQLRKFYDSFLKIFNNHQKYDEKKIELLMLKANVEYSAKRLNTNHFKNFFGSRIDFVVKQNEKDFEKNLKAFKLNLEALVAYFPKDKRRN